MTSLTIQDRLKYFESIRLANERTLWAVLSILGRPDGFLEVGCGDGWVIRTAYSSAIKPAIGVEADNEICAASALGSKLLCRQLDKPFRLFGYFELVFCLNATARMEIDIEGLGANLVGHTSKWLICLRPWPNIVQKHLSLHEEFTDRLHCATQTELGVFCK